MLERDGEQGKKRDKRPIRNKSEGEGDKVKADMNTGWLERARNNRVKRREGGRGRMRGKWIDEERK